MSRQQRSCITGDSASYAANRLAHIVSPPRAGITLALSTAYAGGSLTHVTSVCQPSASGGLSALSSIVDDMAVPPNIFVSGY